MVEHGEAFLRTLGFRVFRVRHLLEADSTPRAKVQIAPEEMSRLTSLQRRLEEGLLAVGYRFVEIDPAGYRSAA